VSVWEPNGRLVATAGHTLGTASVSLSPDGTRVVSCGLDRVLWLWNLDDGSDRELGKTKSEVAALWSSDGSRFAAIDGNNVRIWFADGTLDRTFNHGAEVRVVAWTPDGSQITSAGRDGICRTWDLKGGEGVPISIPARYLAWSPDGQHLATVTEKQFLVGSRSEMKNSPVDFLHGDRLALAGVGGGVRVIGLDGRERFTISTVKPDMIMFAQWSRDGQNLVVAPHLRTLDASGQQLGNFPDLPLVLDSCWSPDGKWLATSTFQDRMIRLFRANGTAGPTFPGRSPCAWSSDGRLAYLDPEKATINVRLEDGTEGPRCDLPMPVGVSYIRMAWRPNSSELLIGGKKELFAWEAKADAIPRRWAKNGLPGECGFLTWKPDGAWLAINIVRNVVLYDRNGEPGPTWNATPDSLILHSTSWHPTEPMLATAGSNGRVCTWDLQGKKSRNGRAIRGTSGSSHGVQRGACSQPVCRAGCFTSGITARSPFVRFGVDCC